MLSVMSTKKISIRAADPQIDMEHIWTIFKKVIQSGDTYVFDPNATIDYVEKYWLTPHIDTFVAETNGEILGTYFIKPNQIDLGNHIANCGYMVSPSHQGKGIGRLLCEHSQEFAISKGYLGIQFNIVVSTNLVAVNLWQKMGFKIIGTTPNGFRHHTRGLVDTYIMYKSLLSQ